MCYIARQVAKSSASIQLEVDRDRDSGSKTADKQQCASPASLAAAIVESCHAHMNELPD